LSCHSLVGSFKIEFFFFFYNIVEYTYEVVQYVSCLCTIYMKAGLSSHVFLLQYEVIIIEL
jgi:hypothetical protein